MSGLTGWGVKEPNFLLRLCLIFFLGMLGFGVAISWRATLLMAAEYQEMPVTQQQLKIKKENEAKRAKLQKKVLKYQVE